MVSKSLKTELNKLAKSELGKSLNLHILDYEKKLQKLVRELELRGQDFKAKGKERFNQITTQVKRTRIDLEKRAADLLEREGKRLNHRLGELAKALKVVAQEQLDSSQLKERIRRRRSKSKPTVECSVKQPDVVTAAGEPSSPSAELP